MDSPVIRKAEDNQLGHTDGDGDGHRDARGVHPSFRSVPTSVSAYNPAEFANLRVSDDVRGVLAHIGAYTPADRVLAATVRHGIPEMQPAVHPPDDFIKPPRPDGATETLGLRILDEPAPLQSDPVLLDLQMRAASRRSVSNDSIAVRTSTARGAQLSREINAWIAAMNDLHRSKPSVSVAYARTMPDLDSLMQEWDAPFDELLGQVPIPPAEIDLSLEEYARLACAIVNIPVHGPSTLTQSLHLLFSLYLEVRDFAQRAGEMQSTE